MVEVPFVNLGFIVGNLVGALIAFIAIMISDKVIAHNIEPKKSLIMSLIALFIVPILATFVAGFVTVLAGIPYMVGFFLPLIFWIILGEVLLSSDRMTKLKVTAVAFVVYIILSIFLTPYIMSVIPF
ncbi:MAG: hypothetical protein QMD85_00545 [Candidatus Aenigmarchaeota archaeon]|nr:hypothetical protein [Candidatus Aenigmarchaeota archaeon]MDI6722008.1 hypothetical protein [Candidatus Aenigmarchaeota archaeon]